MKCPSCGGENPSYVVHCEMCGTQIRKPGTGVLPSANEAGNEEQLRNRSIVTDMSLMAIAVNTRRIFIVLAVGLILGFGTYMVNLWLVVSDVPFDDAESILKTWFGVALIILIVGLGYAIVEKRISRTSKLDKTWPR